MKTSPVAWAPKPMARSASVRPSPRARLIRRLTAIDSPSGNMKASEAQPMAIWCAARATVPSQPIIRATAENTPASNNNMPPAGPPSRSSWTKRTRCQPAHGAVRTRAKWGERRSQTAMAATAASRAIRVAQPEPTSPSAGNPRCPNTSTQLRNAFKNTSVRMIAIGTHGRPNDSANWRCTWKISAGTTEAAISRKNGRTTATTSGGWPKWASCVASSPISPNAPSPTTSPSIRPCRSHAAQPVSSPAP